MTVIDIKDELKQKEFVRNFARLAKLAADYEIDLFTNPRRHLERAYNELYRLHKALEDAYNVLHPIPTFTNIYSSPRPFDIGVIALEQNRKIRNIINDALFPTNEMIE